MTGSRQENEKGVGSRTAHSQNVIDRRVRSRWERRSKNASFNLINETKLQNQVRIRVRRS
jgi:hypothetical protein